MQCHLISYKELLTKDSSVSIDLRNIQTLAAKLRKIKNGLSQEIFTEIFVLETKSYYNLRRWNDYKIPSIRTVYHGSDSISFLGPKIWNFPPDEIKQQTSVNNFKKSIKTRKPQDCPCYCAKFILMVWDFFLSYHKYTKIYRVVVYIFSSLSRHRSIYIQHINVKNNVNCVGFFACKCLFGTVNLTIVNVLVYLCRRKLAYCIFYKFVC